LITLWRLDCCLRGRAALELRGNFADLSAQAIADRLRYLADKLRREGVCEAHDLRHAFADKYYEGSGHDLYTTQKVLGHASIRVTERYLRR
jgi:site-specific recombinase XerD